MKKILFPAFGLFACILLSCGNKTNNTANPQNKDYPVSWAGIDSLKLDMTKAELEKLLNTTLTFKHIKVDGGAADTLPVQYKNMDFVIYLEESDSESVATLKGIRTENASCKTATGLGVGSDKINVIDSYPENKQYVALEYEEYPVRSTTKSVVAVMDTASTSLRAIQFHIINKKVVGVEVNSYYEFY